MSNQDGSTAARLLADVDDMERAATRRAQGYWFVLVLFGAITVLSAALPDDVIGLYWAIVTPAGAIAIGWWYSNRDAAVVRVTWAYLLVPLWMLCAPVVLAQVLDGETLTAAIYVAIGAGYVGFAVLERSVVLGAVGVATAMVAIGFGVFGDANGAGLPLAVGAMWLVVGAVIGWSRR